MNRQFSHYQAVKQDTGKFKKVLEEFKSKEAKKPFNELESLKPLEVEQPQPKSKVKINMKDLIQKKK